MSDLDTALLKMLTAKPFQKDPRPMVTLQKLLAGLARLGSEGAEADGLIQAIQVNKAKGYVLTRPRIIDNTEFPEIEFQLWISPLGRTELERRLAE